jgi:WD40 repeat protein
MGLRIYIGFTVSCNRFVIEYFDLIRFENLILVCSDGKARLWSTETGDITKEYIGHQKPTTCLAFDDRTFR